jgi:hypothetical protein
VVARSTRSCSHCFGLRWAIAISQVVVASRRRKLAASYRHISTIKWGACRERQTIGDDQIRWLINTLLKLTDTEKAQAYAAQCNPATVINDLASLRARSWDCAIFCSEDLESPGKIEVRATLMSSERENAMLESMVQRLSLEPGISACLWASRSPASPGLGVDRRILGLGRSQLGMATGTMGEVASPRVCLAPPHLRALPRRLPGA